MEPVPLDELVRKLGSKYDLVIAAAQRAQQIKDGAPPLIETTSRNPLSIALEEIAAGKILLKELPEDLAPPPDQRVQDYLSRRGSLQDHLGGFIDISDDEEEVDEEELEDEDLELEEEDADLFLEDQEIDFDLEDVDDAEIEDEETQDEEETEELPEEPEEDLLDAPDED